MTILFVNAKGRDFGLNEVAVGDNHSKALTPRRRKAAGGIQCYAIGAGELKVC
jgi:hypothetical protein